MSPHLGHLSLELGFALCLYLRITTFSDRLFLMECVLLGKMSMISLALISALQNLDAKEHCFFFLMWRFQSLCQAVVVGQKSRNVIFSVGTWGVKRGLSLYSLFQWVEAATNSTSSQCNLGHYRYAINFFLLFESAPEYVFLDSVLYLGINFPLNIGLHIINCLLP